MKLLLTGKPGSGKTTALKNFLTNVPHKQGFWTEEVRQDGQRVAFELVSSTGEKAKLASINQKGLQVGRFGVDIDSLDGFLSKMPAIGSKNLIYIDEIGPMELLSGKFRQLARAYLDSPNNFAGTIKAAYDDELVDEVLSRQDIVLLEITKSNRTEMAGLLSRISENLAFLSSLDPLTQAEVTQLAAGYSKQGMIIQLEKLFGSAIKYLANEKVARLGQGHYKVLGNHDEHSVRENNSGWSCDCDLFNGRGRYAGQAGECSHIQAVKLSEAGVK